jgi:hypothetical protein
MSPSDDAPTYELDCFSSAVAGVQLSVKEDGPHNPVEVPPLVSPPKDKPLRVASKLPASFDAATPDAVPKRLSNIPESSFGGGGDKDEARLTGAGELEKADDACKLVPLNPIRGFEKGKCDDDCCC